MRNNNVIMISKLVKDVGESISKYKQRNFHAGTEENCRKHNSGQEVVY
jgi:hypothetical protein